MGKYAYLIMVNAGENNNKFYEMTELDDGTIELHNGRVESTRIKFLKKVIMI